MATLRYGKPCFVGAVELGIPSGRAFLQSLEGRRRRTCAVPCSQRAPWVAPELFCIVRCHGWRPGGARNSLAVALSGSWLPLVLFSAPNGADGKRVLPFRRITRRLADHDSVDPVILRREDQPRVRLL